MIHGMDDCERMMLLREAIERLPPRLNLVINLWREGYNQGEIAIKLGVQQPCISKLITYARHELREILKEME